MNPLVAMVLPLAVWAAHFVFAYAVAAICCAKGAPLSVMRVLVTVATLAALAGVAALARRRSDPFMQFVTKLIAGLAAVAVVYSALVFVAVRDCR